MTYLLLLLAIATEVTATLFLKASDGWVRWQYGVGSILFYALSGVIFAFVLTKMNVGLAYSIWSGAGIALVCLASVLIWQQRFDSYAIAGIGLIVAGSLLITVKSSVVMQ